MATPEKVTVKFVKDLPATAGGFGGGHAKDLTPIVDMLKTRPEAWALIAEGQKSQGALQRLVEFDCEVATRQAAPRTYIGKDGQERQTFLIDIYARYVKGSTAKHEREKAKKEKGEAA